MVITSEGMANVAGLLLSDVGGTTYDFIGIGTGTTAASASDTWLETEDQVAAAVGDRITTTYTNDTARLVKDSFTFSSSKAITECIVATADNDTTGISLCRSTFSAVNVTADDELKVTVTIQIVQGS